MSDTVTGTDAGHRVPTRTRVKLDSRKCTHSCPEWMAELVRQHGPDSKLEIVWAAQVDDQIPGSMAVRLLKESVTANGLRPR